MVFIAKAFNYGMLSQPPYYNRFDSTKNRDYIAFEKDRVLQSGELNELQSIFNYYLQATGNAVMDDGDKQYGMTFEQNGNNITVSNGAVYLAGKVRNFNSQTVTITGNGMENVGVKISSSLVTSSDDPTLLNPAIGTAGYQSPGADRVQEDVVLTVNDSAAATIYVFNNGSLYYTPASKQLTKVSDMIARQTYEIEGNFRLGTTGFELSTKDDPNNEDKAIININNGIAYIQGYRVEKDTATQIEADKSLNTSTINDEEHSYLGSDKGYAFNNQPMANVKAITANVQKTAVVSASGTGTDNLPDLTVFKVLNVFTEGSNGINYVNGTDYSLLNGQQIQWLSGGNSPQSGHSYKVTYIYQRTLQEDTDYEVVTIDGVDGIAVDNTPLANATDDSNGKYTSDSIFSFTYDYYLYRADVVTLDKNGNFVIHEGQPSTSRNFVYPTINDDTVLVIGTVVWQPNSSDSNCVTNAPSNLTFRQLNDVVNRINDIEYNEALNALTEIATASYDPTKLRGVFSDGFISFDKADTTHPKYSVKMNFDDGIISPLYATSELNDVSIDNTQSSISITKGGKFITTNYTEQQIASQVWATSAINVNPYNYYGRTGSMVLDPSVDQWTNYDTTNPSQTTNS